jgi:hypothetical protein
MSMWCYRLGPELLVQTPKPPKSKLLSAVLMRWMVSLLRYKNDKDRVLRK